ncbi:MAG: AAA family ATPase [Verrucomicrobiota bacterium]
MSHTATAHTHAAAGHTFAAHSAPLELADAVFDTPAVMDPPALAGDSLKTPDPAVFTALKTLVENGHNGEQWSRNKVAKALGISGATISIYLAQDQAQPPPLKANLRKLESSIAELLATLSAKRRFDGALFETHISRKMGQWIGMVRATNTIGLYVGEAGIGKSCGLEIYSRQNPTALTIAARPWRRTRDAVVTMLWEQFDTRGWNRRSPRADWIAQHLTGMETVILLDDCHTLTFAALEYLIYLAVETGTPLVMVGNPRVLEKLRPEPQLFSRVFLKQEGTLPAGKALNDAVEAVLSREAPEHIPALRTMAREVAAQPGHLRGLIQRCRAMHEMMGQFAEYAGNAAAAFHAAHALSIHSGYTLTAP